MVQEKLRAVFYARVSTEEERQLNALEKQVAECKDAILQKGWKLVDQYVDEGKSGTQIKRRDEYRRLFEDLENDKFDIVVIKSQDRLQRNTLDWYIWIDRLTTHGKRLYMYLEDTFYSPDNALISGIKAILAEEYSRELSKKINNSYKRRIEAAKNGEKISIVNNSRSLGYDKVNGELVINEKEAEVVRMIFNMYASGEGLRAISNTLYDMGYRNKSGNEIDPTTISRMLSSEKYKGVYVINQRHYDFDTKKTVLNPKSEWVHIPGAVPAIVEPELWDRVQEIKGSKVQSIKNEKRGRNCGKSIFSGKIYCAKCGAKYWRSLENGYVKFKCSSYSKYGKIPGKGCDNKSFSENALYSILQSLSEQIVEVNTVEVRKSLLNWLESLRERLRASQGDDTIKEEIRKQTARKEKLTDAYMDGIISKEDYSKRYKELEKTLEDLKDKLLTLEVNEDLQSIEEVIQNIDKEMEEYLQTQSFTESRVEFLNQHLTKVTVNKDSFLLEFDLIGGAILTGKDFYLFVDNPRANCKIKNSHFFDQNIFHNFPGDVESKTEIENSSFENKIGLGVGCFAFCKIGETFTESVIAVNKFVFHIFLYPPINTHFLYCQSQKYQFSLAFQSSEDHLLTALDYHSRILQNQYHWWGLQCLWRRNRINQGVLRYFFCKSWLLFR